MSMPVRNFKQQAHDMVDQLPDTAGWGDLAYEASALQDIEDALHDSDADCVLDNNSVRSQFGLGEYK